METVNKETRELKLLDADGNRTTVVVEDAPLNMVEVGDQVRLRVARAMVISMVAPDAG